MPSKKKKSRFAQTSFGRNGFSSSIFSNGITSPVLKVGPAVPVSSAARATGRCGAEKRGAAKAAGSRESVACGGPPGIEAAELITERCVSHPRKPPLATRQAQPQALPQSPARRPRRGERLAVREHAIELPARALRIARPDLVLHRVTAGPIGFDLARDAGGREPRDRRVDLGLLEDLDPQMVEALGRVGHLEQDQLQRRPVDREVRVAGLALVHLRAEELPVVVDRLVEIATLRASCTRMSDPPLPGRGRRHIDEFRLILEPIDVCQCVWSRIDWPHDDPVRPEGCCPVRAVRPLPPATSKDW